MQPHINKQVVIKKLISEGKAQQSKQLCAEEGCQEHLYEFTVPMSDPLVINATRSHPFGYICDKCDIRRTYGRILAITSQR